MVERKKTKSERWIRLNVEPLPFIEYEARRMIEGTEYQIRIRAVNEVGYSDPSPASIPFTPLGEKVLRINIKRFLMHVCSQKPSPLSLNYFEISAYQNIFIYCLKIKKSFKVLI